MTPVKLKRDSKEWASVLGHRITAVDANPYRHPHYFDLSNGYRLYINLSYKPRPHVEFTLEEQPGEPLFPEKAEVGP